MRPLALFSATASLFTVRRLRVADKVGLDLGNIRKGQDWIARPVEARDHGAVELQFLDQRAADGLQDVAVDLVAQSVGIDDLAAVMGHGDARDADETA